MPYILTKREIKEAISEILGPLTEETGQIVSESAGAGEDGAAVLEVGDYRREVILKYDVDTTGAIYFETGEDGDWFRHDIFQSAVGGETNIAQYIVESVKVRIYVDGAEFNDTDVNTLKLISKQ